MIKYVQGNLFDFVQPRVIIPHVVNNAGAMASGFVVPLCKKYPTVKSEYFTEFNGVGLRLGYTQFITVESNVIVANMIAQTLYDRKRPLRYNSLVDCMLSVGDHAEVCEYSILTPKFGSERAGGNWEFIECLIEDIWDGIDVTIVEYEK